MVKSQHRITGNIRRMLTQAEEHRRKDESQRIKQVRALVEQGAYDTDAIAGICVDRLALVIERG